MTCKIYKNIDIENVIQPGKLQSKRSYLYVELRDEHNPSTPERGSIPNYSPGERKLPTPPNPASEFSLSQHLLSTLNTCSSVSSQFYQITMSVPGTAKAYSLPSSYAGKLRL